MLGTFFNRVEKILGWTVGILCMILLSALFIQVVNRYLFGISWAFIQFLVPFCFLWMCMIGTALAVRRNEHFEVDLLANYLGPKARFVQAALMSILVFFGGGVIVWTSLGFVDLGFLKRDPSTGIKMVYIYSSLLVGGALICLLSLEKLYLQFFTENKKTLGGTQ